MLTFDYTARDIKSGKKVKAQVMAESQAAAAKLLSEKGLAPIDIRANTLSQNSGVMANLNKIKTKDKILFSRQLSTLINAGLPLVQSLNNVQQHTQNKKLQAVISDVISDVEGGKSLSEALGRHPTVFSQVYISLVAAGETSGTLDKALERIATQQEKDAEIISKVRGAMVYPLIVLLVMLGVVGFMVVRVLPQVEGLYNSLPDATLPVLTRVLLSISRFTTTYWWVVLIIFGFIAFFTSRWARTGPGKLVIDRAKMRAWPVGPLFMKLYMARFARSGATLVGTGVPLIQMLQITGNAISNVHIKGSLDRAAEKVKGGKALSDSLQGDDNFLDLVPDMLRIGEQSGTIEDMLEKTADYYEKEVDNQIKTISTIIEPVMMVILGVLALIIVAAILLPIYGLADKNVIR